MFSHFEGTAQTCVSCCHCLETDLSGLAAFQGQGVLVKEEQPVSFFPRRIRFSIALKTNYYAGFISAASRHFSYGIGSLALTLTTSHENANAFVRDDPAY